MSQATDTPFAKRRTSRARRLIVAAVTVSLLIALCSVSLTLGRYETTHDIPNPWWGVLNGEYTYTPEQGPPSAELMVTRPETIVSRYLEDYIRLAATFPCVADLRRYGITEDIVLQGGKCSIVRPVASYQISRIHMLHHGFMGFPEALLDASVTYSDGTQFAMTFHMNPRVWRRYGVTHVQMDC